MEKPKEGITPNARAIMKVFAPVIVLGAAVATFYLAKMCTEIGGDNESQAKSTSRDITQNKELDSIKLNGLQVLQYTPRTVMLTRGKDKSVDLLDTDTKTAIATIEQVCGRRSALPPYSAPGFNDSVSYTGIFIDTNRKGCIKRIRFTLG